MVEGHQTTLADHFQALDWPLDTLDSSKLRFLELSQTTRRRLDSDAWKCLSSCALTAWAKAHKYYLKADTESPAYYAAIILNPTLKLAWFEQVWRGYDIKSSYIDIAKRLVNTYWQDSYRGKTSHLHNKCEPSSKPTPTLLPRAPFLYTSARDHKRLRLSAYTPTEPLNDFYTEYIETAPLAAGQVRAGAALDTSLAVDDIIAWWNNRYYTWPDLARFALDILAVPPMSDECERLFSSTSILLEKRRRRLGMDIIEANECLRSSYGPQATDAFDDAEHAASLGASRASPASLAEQAEERLRTSHREEADAMATDGDDEALAEQELREAEEEAILEGPALAIEVVYADYNNIAISDGSGISI
jgi:hypothetical protein